MANRGIYLVANEASSRLCNNLVFSVRSSGCRLPIRVIPYGGAGVRFQQHYPDVAVVELSHFPRPALSFLEQLEQGLPGCSSGLLRRFLAWFGEFDEFLYSDNDIVATMNWTELFDYLGESDLVHADEEYKTGGRFNFARPIEIQRQFGEAALEQAITAGHFVCRKSPKHVSDFLAALDWFQLNPTIPKWHDQALLHVAVLLGKWKIHNLCKPPHSWSSSWAGDYSNTLAIIHAIQSGRTPISHIHYSGRNPSGTESVDELLFSSLGCKQRQRLQLFALLRELTGLQLANKYVAKITRRFAQLSPRTRRM